MVIRCSSNIKCDYACPFYAKLRRSNKDKLWYICAGIEIMHKCPAELCCPNYSQVENMMAARQMEEDDDSEEDVNARLNRHLSILLQATEMKSRS